MQYNIDGYQSKKDWMSQHAHLIPSENIYLRSYVPLESVQVTYQEVTPYSPRPSFLKELGIKATYQDIVSQFNLNERELKVMRCLFIENMTQEETSVILECSQSLISLIRGRIIKKMKAELLN